MRLLTLQRLRRSRPSSVPPRKDPYFSDPAASPTRVFAGLLFDGKSYRLERRDRGAFRPLVSFLRGLLRAYAGALEAFSLGYVSFNGDTYFYLKGCLRDDFMVPLGMGVTTPPPHTVVVNNSKLPASFGFAPPGAACPGSQDPEVAA